MEEKTLEKAIEILENETDSRKNIHFSKQNKIKCKAVKDYIYAKYADAFESFQSLNEIDDNLSEIIMDCGKRYVKEINPDQSEDLYWKRAGEVIETLNNIIFCSPTVKKYLDYMETLKDISPDEEKLTLSGSIEKIGEEALLKHPESLELHTYMTHFYEEHDSKEHYRYLFNCCKLGYKNIDFLLKNFGKKLWSDFIILKDKRTNPIDYFLQFFEMEKNNDWMKKVINYAEENKSCRLNQLKKLYQFVLKNNPNDHNARFKLEFIDSQKSSDEKKVKVEINNQRSLVHIKRKPKIQLMKATEIYEKLSKHILGQEKAIKNIAENTSRHLCLVDLISKKKDVYTEKNNMLFIGDTGTGKTYTCRILAKVLGLPLIVGNATTLTQTGYVGENAETLIEKLYYKANQDISLASKGIIFIDEVDKIRKEKTGGQRDVGGEGVQQELLHLIEDSNVSFMNNERKPVEINTRNIMFIFGGSFLGSHEKDGLKSIFEKKEKSIGFRTKEKQNKERIQEEKDYVDLLTIDHLYEFGLLKEFMSRIPIKVGFNNLNQEDLYRISYMPPDSMVNQFTQLYENKGIKLSFEDEALKTISIAAHNYQQGARGLRTMFTKIFKGFDFKIEEEDIKEYVFTNEFVEKILEYYLNI